MDISTNVYITKLKGIIKIDRKYLNRTLNRATS